MQKKPHSPWINASSIGTANFCPNVLVLRQKQLKLNKQMQHRMQEGRELHWLASRECSGLTALVFSPQHYIACTVHYWRIEILEKKWYGIFFVKLYSKLLPYLIAINRYYLGKQFLRYLFKRLYRKIKRSQKCL